MLKKVILAVALVALAAGTAAGVRSVSSDDATCNPPITKMSSEIDASIATLEAYISENIAPLYAKPAELDWSVQGGVPLVTPKRISIVAVVGEGYDGWGGFFGPARIYTVEITRACSGGKWEVTKFKRLEGQAPEPKAKKETA